MNNFLFSSFLVVKKSKSLEIIRFQERFVIHLIDERRGITWNILTQKGLFSWPPQ